MPALLVALIVVASACTGEEGRAVTPSPSPSPSLIPAPGGYLYRGPGIEATFEITAEQGQLVVLNATGADLADPGIYLLDARDGARVDAEVAEAAPVPDGDTMEFDVSISGAPEAKHVGLVVLTFGHDDFGAFAPAREKS